MIVLCNDLIKWQNFLNYLKSILDRIHRKVDFNES